MTEKREGREEKKISVRFPDTLPLGPQPTERLTRGAMRWYWTSLVDGPMLLRLLADGDGSSGRGQPEASPPFPAPPPTWRMAAGSGPLANGADSSAPSRMAATPPRPRSTAASLPSHLLFHCSSTTASFAHFISLRILPLIFVLIFILLFPIFIYILLCYVSFLVFLHCPLSGPVLIYISLLIISCIIEYVTNKITLNLVA